MEYVTKIIPEEGQKWYQDTLNVKRYHRLDSLYKLQTNEVKKEKLIERMMLLSDESAKINYNKYHFENIQQTRKMSKDSTFLAICILMSIGSLSLLGALFGWQKWSKQQMVLDDIILQQYKLQNLEFRFKELELKEKMKLLNLDEGGLELDIPPLEIEPN